jgi:hypothetical protein
VCKIILFCQFVSTAYYFDSWCQQHMILKVWFNKILCWQFDRLHVNSILCLQLVCNSTLFRQFGVNSMLFWQLVPTHIILTVNFYYILIWQFVSTANYFDSWRQHKLFWQFDSTAHYVDSLINHILFWQFRVNSILCLHLVCNST